MSRILGHESGKKPTRGFGGKGWVVSGVMFSNSAAKFWSVLLDELLADFPGCDTVQLSALSGGMLTADLLRPEQMLQESLEGLDVADLRTAFRDTIAQLELLGPPSPIRVHLSSGGREMGSMDLPLDCADADLLPYLLVWLLEWAAISEYAWNRESVGGEMVATDSRRGYVYAIRFDLQNRHLSEGLFDRQLSVRFRRETVQRHRPGAPASPQTRHGE